jgi:hypothetical protein
MKFLKNSFFWGVAKYQFIFFQKKFGAKLKKLLLHRHFYLPIYLDI